MPEKAPPPLRGAPRARLAVVQPPHDLEGMRVNSDPPPASNRRDKEADRDHDRDLIERAQTGDEAAFRRLLERHQRRAFGVAYALVKDEEDAREIVQEAFVRVHRGLGRFHGGSSFFTWLYRIVTNLAIDVIRKPARRERELIEDVETAAEDEWPLSTLDGGDPLEALHRSELRERIQAAFDALPAYHRGVIVMRELQGMSYEEMAIAMGVSKGTIMSRLFHARRKLQKALADCYVQARRAGGTVPPESDA